MARLHAQAARESERKKNAAKLRRLKTKAKSEAAADLTQSKLRDWCEKHFLGFLRMREWR